MSDGKTGQPIHYYQSAWMGHRTGYNASTQKHNQSFSPRGGNRNHHDMKTLLFLTGAEIARSAKVIREVEHATSSRKLADESLSCQLLSTAELCQESRGSFASLNGEKEIISMKELRPQASRGKLPAAETSTGECQFQPEGLLQLPVEQVKYHMFFGENNFSCSRQRSTVSASHAVPNKLDIDQFKFDSGRPIVPLVIHRQEETKQVTSILSSKHVTETNLTNMGQENCNYQGRSAVLVCEGKTSNLPECETAATSYLRQDNMTALKIGPSASTYKSPTGDDGARFFPTSSHPSEMNKPGIVQYGQSRFSKTTQRLLIAKNTDINLCKENQNLRDSKGTSQLDKNAFSELHRNIPLFNHGKQGVKLQLLGSSTDSEEKVDAEAVKTTEIVHKNGSSTETDIMDMECFREKDHLSGASPSPSKRKLNPSSSNKDMMMDPNLAPQIDSTGSRKRSVELPDINMELPAAPASPQSEKPEPSTSKTQSLDMEILLVNSDKPGNSKSSDCPYAARESELSSRWVKRLKLTTPTSNLEEPLSHEDRKKFLNKTMKGTTSSSGSTMGHRLGKELMALDQTTKLLKTGESSSIDTGMKGQDITLSHSWIQRWRHNQDIKKPKALGTCDPQNSKLGTDDLEKKIFPSIAAMALMGKVLNGFFQPCQFQKKKSFIVWNTKKLVIHKRRNFYTRYVLNSTFRPSSTVFSGNLDFFRGFFYSRYVL